MSVLTHGQWELSVLVATAMEGPTGSGVIHPSGLLNYGKILVLR